MWSLLPFTFIAVAATTCLTAIVGQATTCPCGWVNNFPKQSTNVIGGDDVSDHEYPFLATVYKKLSWKKEPICGATIITSSNVITAAHCVDDISSYFVLVGVTDLSKAGPSDFIAVSDIETAVGFDKSTNLNDIAILTLSVPLDFSTRNIGPVCIPSFGIKQNELPNVVRILGWSKAAHKLSGRLQKVDSHVVNIKDCSAEYPHLNEEKQFCTYDTGKGPIKGDSGGPALWWDPEIMGYTLVGIVSMGPEEESSIPIIHTFVPFNPYLKFINAQSSGEVCRKV
ncbi:venom serine protease [Halyomorpha halys]|uniref:venom serine protease n=1 Tax=Halyomorpha halys TaxID=286706 RepID=UPI0034D1CB8B